MRSQQRALPSPPQFAAPLGRRQREVEGAELTNGEPEKCSSKAELRDRIYEIVFFFFISTLLFWLRLSVLSKISFSRLKCA